MARALDDRVLHPDRMNENVRKAQYAVRGELFLRASELQKQGREVVLTNVGNPHALGQKPITFPRQVMALIQAPFLLDDPNVGKLFPPDAIARAKYYLHHMQGGVGAYSDSKGLPIVRQEVAEFIKKRDGYPRHVPHLSTDPEHVFLTDGASKGITQAMQCLIRDDKDGIMCPIPQYPLYSATVQLLGGELVPYLLEEEAAWAMNMDELRQALSRARGKGIEVRGLVFINPGNPTGQCLSVPNLQDMLKFCCDEGIVLFADEVYQDNVYQDERPFVSAKKVLMDMGSPYAESVELFSFHSVSKGSFGECGQRGSYFEMTNIHPKIIEELYKVASVSLSPNVNGQLMMGLMINPPQPGDPSYAQHRAERKAVLDSLRRRAHMMTDGFNDCENIECNFTEGALYSFPKLKLSDGAIKAAEKAGKAPDTFYCLELLEATGISTVPGSGFGQKEGTFHLRTTILPQEEMMPRIVDKIKRFNADFTAKYSNMRTSNDSPMSRL
eukprot:SM000082S22847  [mRNA]  locus=s82:191590:196000:- [translate_table: standard]